MSQHTVKIRGLGSEGEGVGSLDGLTLFVDGALPGETVRCEITVQKRSYAKAKLLEILEPSPDRVQPVCPVFGRCGGCQLMHLSYSGQLEVKRQRVVDALKRIGHLDVDVAPCRPSPKPLAYRNKIQLPKGIGLYARGSHDIVPIERCPIHCEQGDSVFQAIRPLMTLDIRYLIIRTAVSTGQVLVVLVTENPTGDVHLAEKILPHARGVVHNYNPHPHNTILTDAFTTLAGDSYIEETICGETFKVSAASFFQVNPFQAPHLYRRALELADLKPTDIALDLYCGVGTLTRLIAKQVKQVIGIESVPQAIADAEGPATYLCAQVEEIKFPAADVTFLNPPRKGCDPRVLERLTSQRLIYISCNPATLARDLALLKHYQIEAVEPFDMFPQTSHVECIVKLKTR